MISKRLNNRAIHGTGKNMFVPDVARHQFILCHFNNVMARIYSKKHEMIAAQQSAIAIHTWHKYFFDIKNYFYCRLLNNFLILCYLFLCSHRCEVCGAFKIQNNNINQNEIWKTV